MFISKWEKTEIYERIQNLERKNQRLEASIYNFEREIFKLRYPALTIPEENFVGPYIDFVKDKSLYVLIALIFKRFDFDFKRIKEDISLVTKYKKGVQKRYYK
jgi:hypothetical protein